MEENQSKLDSFIDYINAHILPFIDYNELDASYRTAEKAYAKGILNRLHTAMLEQYGDTRLACGHGDMQEEYAVVPGVVQGKNTGEIALALLGIDLSSSGRIVKQNFSVNMAWFHRGIMIYRRPLPVKSPQGIYPMTTATQRIFPVTFIFPRVGCRRVSRRFCKPFRSIRRRFCLKKTRIWIWNADRPAFRAVL